MIKLEHITKIYRKKKIINDLSLTLPDVGLVLFKGQNGSGKTTLMNIIAKRIRCEGNISYSNNINLKDDLYYSFSNDELYLNLTVLEKTDLILTNSEKEQFLDYIDKFELHYILKNKIKELSSGERQKLELIYVFCKHKAITLIDEPFEFIDRESKPLFINEIKELAKSCLVIETAHTLIHDSDYILNFSDGKISEEVNYDTAKLTLDKCENNEKHKVFKNSFKLFKHQPLKYIIPINIFILFFTLILTLFINSISLDNRAIYDNVFTTYTPFTYEGNIDSQSVEYYNSKEIKNKLTPFDIALEIDNRLSSLSNLIDPNIIPSSKIIYEGEEYTLNDEDIFMSDYLYACLHSRKSFKLNGKFYDVPIIDEDMELYPFSDLKLFRFETYNIPYKLKIYRTDYLDYLPKESNSKDLKNEQETFAKRVDLYYNNVIVNDKMYHQLFDYFLDIPLKEREQFYTDNSEKNNSIYINLFNDYAFNYYDLTIKYDASPIINHSLFEPKETLKDDEFYCFDAFASKYLGIPSSEFHTNLDAYLNKYYDFKIGDFDFHMKLVRLSYPYTIDSFNLVYFNYNNVKKLYDSLDIKNTTYLNYGKNSSDEMIKYKINTISDMDNLYNNIDNIDFNAKGIYLDKVSYNEMINHILEIAIYSFSGILLVILVLYLIFSLRPNLEKEKLLLYKNYSLSEVLILNYLPRLILTLFIVILSIGLGNIIFIPIAKLLNILI